MQCKKSNLVNATRIFLSYDTKVMSSPALILLADYSSSPKEIIGERAYNQGILFSQEISVPRSFCLTVNTLKSIALLNSLETKIKRSDLITSKTKGSNPKVTSKFIELFTSLRIPRDLAIELIESYQQYLFGEHVHILPSNSPNLSSKWVDSNVKGDSNMVESILRVWGRLTLANILNTPKSTPLQTKLYSSPIMVELAPNAEASGVAYTRDPETGIKTYITIYGVNGVFSPQNSKVYDTFKVDVRTWNLIEKQIANKKQHYTRGNEALSLNNTPIAKQAEATLDWGTAESIARTIFKLKQHTLEQQKVYWSVINHQPLITAIEPMSDYFEDNTGERGPSIKGLEKTSTQAKSTLANQKKPTHITALYVSAGNKDKAGHQVKEIADGVGLLRSEYAIAKLGIHPQHILKGTRLSNQLRNELIETILTYSQYLKNRLLIYRTQNFTSSELAKLKFSGPYEFEEPNPYLGYRGGLRISTRPELFSFELDALMKATNKVKQTPIGVMIPFVRSPGELRTAIGLIAQSGLMHKSKFQVWWQLNTIENLVNIKSYPLAQINGLSINIKSLHGLIYGIDPDNSEMLLRYPLPTPIIISEISKLLNNLRETEVFGTTKVVVHMENYDAFLTQELIKIGINGIIVKPQSAEVALDTILETEQRLVI